MTKTASILDDILKIWSPFRPVLRTPDWHKDSGRHFIDLDSLCLSLKIVKFTLCWWLSWPKLSPASQNCHQYISSQTCISDSVTDAASPVGEASSFKNMFDSNFSYVPHLIHLSKNPWNPVYTVWSSLKPKLKTSLFAWLFAYYENKFPKHK